jgi:hypothetical protein
VQRICSFAFFFCGVSCKGRWGIVVIEGHAGLLVRLKGRKEFTGNLRWKMKV